MTDTILSPMWYKLRDKLTELKTSGQELRFNMIDYIWVEHDTGNYLPKHQVREGVTPSIIRDEDLIRDLEVEEDEWCGTAACLAGWALVLDGSKTNVGMVEYDAAQILGLDRVEAFCVFMGHWIPGEVPGYPGPLDGATIDQAIEFIDSVIANGGNVYAAASHTSGHLVSRESVITYHGIETDWPDSYREVSDDLAGADSVSFDGDTPDA